MPRWYVQRHHINSQGYDRSGCYWGGGIPLWYCYSADGKHEFWIRGTKDYAVEAYKFARKQKNPDEVCFKIRTTGTWK